MIGFGYYREIKNMNFFFLRIQDIKYLEFN